MVSSFVLAKTLSLSNNDNQQTKREMLHMSGENIQIDEPTFFFLFTTLTTQIAQESNLLDIYRKIKLIFGDLPVTLLVACN